MLDELGLREALPLEREEEQHGLDADNDGRGCE